MKLFILTFLICQEYRKKQQRLSWTVNPAASGVTSASVLTVDIWNFITIPAVTATVRAARLSWKKSGWTNAGRKSLTHELNPIIYCNQKLLYDLLHRCSAETLLELSADRKWLGATPGIIQVLHTWNQELNYHVHMHCIISGGGLTKEQKIRKSSSNFFIPTGVLRDKFKGKYLALLQALYEKGSLSFSSSCNDLQDASVWKKWCCPAN